MLGDRLQELRKRKGLSQIEVSQIFNTQQASYSKWELNKRNPDYDTLKRIASYYDVSLDYLLEHTNKNESKLSKLEKILDDDKKNTITEICKLIYPNEYKKIDLK